jgi:hypothetical protein
MKKMMKMASTGTLLMLAAVGSLLAHHALVQYDTTTPVRVRGTVVVFERVNPHSRLVVDEKQKDGRIHRWVVDGPNTLQLIRRDFAKDSLKAGDIVEVCGYVTKAGTESQRTLFMEPSISGQILDGETLVMPDGRKQAWNDYGVHKCLGPDYVDNHTTGVSR